MAVVLVLAGAQTCFLRFSLYQEVCLWAALWGALFVAAACAEGMTRIRDAAELRVKESDRIAGMAAGLRRLGIAVAETPDGVDIEGGRLLGGRVESGGDHRVAMAFA